MPSDRLQPTLTNPVQPPVRSAVATARFIDDFINTPYPEGISRPTPNLNANAKGQNFKYDRDFLLQFMSICKQKPDMLPALDAIVLEPIDQVHPAWRVDDGGLRLTDNGQPLKTHLPLLPNPPSPLTASTAYSQFAPRPKVVIRKADGTEATIENVKGSSPPQKNNVLTNSPSSTYRQGSSGPQRQSVNLETSGQRDKRVPQEEPVKAEAGSVENLTQEKEAQEKKSKEQEEKRRKKKKRQEKKNGHRIRKVEVQEGICEAEADTECLRPREFLSKGTGGSVPAGTPKPPALYGDCRNLLLVLVKNDASRMATLNVKDEEIQYIVDFLSSVLNDGSDLSLTQRRHLLYVLVRLAKSAQVFPECYRIEDVQFEQSDRKGGGSHGDIYRGAYGNRVVCVKASRAFKEIHIRAHAMELILLGNLSHPNVLPFYGICFPRILGGLACIISPWMDNGDLDDFLKSAPWISPVPLISDITNGLQYLHYMDIIHSDLKAKNILVSCNKRAVIGDFGVSKIVMTDPTTTDAPFGTANWMARELLVEDDKPPTKQSDIWALACVCYEAFTGKVPFFQKASTALIIKAFMRSDKMPLAHQDLRQQSPIATSLWRDIWAFMTQCWNYDPTKRPTTVEAQVFWNNLNVSDHRLDDPIFMRDMNPNRIMDYTSVYRILREVHNARRADKSADAARLPSKADLSNFGKLSKALPTTFGPESVFAGKKDKHEPLSRTSPSSNMFSMLQKAEGGADKTPDAQPQRKKLALLPRSKPLEAETQQQQESSEDEDVLTSTVSAELNEEAADQKIKEDLKEFFAVRNLDEAEVYFTALPAHYHIKLVDKLVSNAVESKEADARLVAELFSRAVSKNLCLQEVFEQGFMPCAEIKGAGFDEE